MKLLVHLLICLLVLYVKNQFLVKSKLNSTDSVIRYRNISISPTGDIYLPVFFLYF